MQRCVFIRFLKVVKFSADQEVRKLLHNTGTERVKVLESCFVPLYTLLLPNQTLCICMHFSYDCSNPIYGQTLNPCNLQKTPGGSSGGEGALIGGGGSILGIGTDIGGSIRIPASFCGICGFKPTSRRLRYVCIFQCEVTVWWESFIFQSKESTVGFGSVMCCRYFFF